MKSDLKGLAEYHSSDPLFTYKVTATLSLFGKSCPNMTFTVQALSSKEATDKVKGRYNVTLIQGVKKIQF